MRVIRSNVSWKRDRMAPCRWKYFILSKFNCASWSGRWLWIQPLALHTHVHLHLRIRRWHRIIRALLPLHLVCTPQVAQMHRRWWEIQENVHYQKPMLNSGWQQFVHHDDHKPVDPMGTKARYICICSRAPRGNKRILDDEGLAWLPSGRYIRGKTSAG